MSTYGDMSSRVADEMARSDLTTQVQGAIMRAIRYYERRRWWFNQVMFTWSSVAGQEYYSDVDAGNRTISRLKSVDSAMLIVGNNRYPLTERTWQYIQQVSITTTTYGQPQDFALYAVDSWSGFDGSTANQYSQQFRVYPISDLGTYTFQVSGLITLLDNEGLGPYAFPTNTTKDVWSLDCEDLICTRAKWDVCKNYLKDMDAAGAAKAEETEALQSLVRLNTARMSSGSIQPNPF